MINMILEDYKEVLRQKDDLGTWKTHNHYPVGWAHAMNAPFQWVKTSCLALRRHRQRDGHLLAGPHQGQGRHPAAVAPRDRHRADNSGRDRAGAALIRQRGGAEAHRGREHGLHVRQSQSAVDAPHTVFRDLRPSRHLSRRLGGLHDASFGGHGRTRPSSFASM